MGLVARMAPYWTCDVCKFEWFANTESGPRQCPECHSRKWNDGMVRDADLYQKSLVIRHLNPYRQPLSVRQKAALVRIAANRRAESAANDRQCHRFRIAIREKVLFVAEKRAALEVLKHRLDRLNLGAPCLALHSNKAKKKEVIAELKRTALMEIGDASQGNENVSLLKEAKAKLNDYCKAVNGSFGNSGETVRDLFGILLPILRRLEGTERPYLEIPACIDWTAADLQRRQQTVSRLQERLAETGVPSQHPFWGTELRTVLPSTKDDTAINY